MKFIPEEFLSKNMSRGQFLFILLAIIPGYVAMKQLISRVSPGLTAQSGTPYGGNSYGGNA